MDPGACVDHTLPYTALYPSQIFCPVCQSTFGYLLKGPFWRHWELERVGAPSSGSLPAQCGRAQNHLPFLGLSHVEEGSLGTPPVPKPLKAEVQRPP